MCTGKSKVAAVRYHKETVYPRVYGEIPPEVVLYLPLAGLPPCVRGNLEGLFATIMTIRSTPVCTGKSSQGRPSSSLFQVYPRVYGEIGSINTKRTKLPGLPPCVRGNLITVAVCVGCLRSTPVCTGKSRSQSYDFIQDWVYPRVYGEICDLSLILTSLPGLPPCVRGNLVIVAI